MTRTSRMLTAALTALMVGAIDADAQTLTPQSYTATAGQAGGVTYFDDTGKQLTDGVLGADGWWADLGNGIAYEWMGWATVNPTLHFVFASAVNISQVSIGFNRGSGMVNLPFSVDLNGSVFGVSPTALGYSTRGFLDFATQHSGNTFDITLNHASYDDGGVIPGWIMVDEVRFTGMGAPKSLLLPGSNVTPEPASLALMATGLVGVVGISRRRKGKQRAAAG